MTTTPIRFWVDPICPWCWVTALWIRTVAPERGLDITWEPISLLMKNEVGPESEYYEAVAWSLGLLRVMESVRGAGGAADLGELYVEYGRRIHHDGDRSFAAEDALRAVGIDVAHAAAASDPTWDAEVRRRMDEGLAFVGTDVGTPAAASDPTWDAEVRRRMDEGLAFVGTDVGTPIIGIGEGAGTVGIFGPVITRVPPRDDALALWDATTTLARLDGFWELKRTRTERPDPGPRP